MPRSGFMRCAPLIRCVLVGRGLLSPIEQIDAEKEDGHENQQPCHDSPIPPGHGTSPYVALAERPSRLSAMQSLSHMFLGRLSIHRLRRNVAKNRAFVQLAARQQKSHAKESDESN